MFHNHHLMLEIWLLLAAVVFTLDSILSRRKFLQTKHQLAFSTSSSGIFLALRVFSLLLAAFDD